jgi:hypothetical protein
MELCQPKLKHCKKLTLKYVRHASAALKLGSERHAEDKPP